MLDSRPEACPVCGAGSCIEFLRREAAPVHQNLLFSTPTEARRIGRGQLSMVVCKACGFVFNRDFDSRLLHYGAHYDNTQTHSPVFDEHVTSLARRLLADGVTNCHIVEVGCGKGDFLRRLVADPSAGNRGIGFDPSYLGAARELAGRAHFERRFFDASCADIAADVVVCRHVIEHIERPVDFLRAIRMALARTPSARLFFETPCVRWILENQVIWDFFYEHCSLFTRESLSTTFRQAGFRVRSVEHVFRGQYLWLEAACSADSDAAAGDVAFAVDNPIVEPGDIAVWACRFRQVECLRRESWRGAIQRMRRAGGVALWGAGAKGATFANLIDPGKAILSCVVDVNPNKQNRFLPGTGHAIVSPEALTRHNVATIILLNPNYHDEVVKTLARLGLRPSLIDLIPAGEIAA